ncbi:hypothetical protein [Nocardia vermiculata]|uniref:Uncharacterized protein n=1 Tax=Nocardia vermiculata TaxID=257274 RepID=A0A846Y7K6_9NOCA|nr:hypothetical protein [Nocardia vermiculata]NKY53794.1 hypothetical protein [Nocardia vermiculata]
MVTARNDARQALSASLIKVLIAHGLVHCSGASAPVAALLERDRPDPIAALLIALGIDPSATRARLQG